MSINKSDYKISIPFSVVLVLAYIAIGVAIPTALDLIIWRPLGGEFSVWLNISASIIINIVFFVYASKITRNSVSIFGNISMFGIMATIGCALLLFLLLDCFLDPLFESLFPVSATEYQQSLAALRQSPTTTFIQVCLIAPIVEELLMRHYVLKGIKNKHGVAIALIVSTLLFSVLHFNFMQTLSAVVGGLIIGMLYIKTDSLFCCILTHALYNSISYFTQIVIL